MKKTFRFFALAAVVAAFASCDKVETVNQPAKNNISIRIGTETKSLLRNGAEVHWSSQDKIRVFDDANVGFKFETTNTDVATAVFTCTDEGGWTGGVPVMAIHSYRPTVNQTAFDGTKVTANIYQNQMIHHNGSYARDGSLSIGVVSKEGADYVVDEMKNCFSLIKFQLENKDITSVKMRGNNNEILAGWVNVSYNSGNPTWEVDGDRGEKEITITPGSNVSHSSTNAFFAVDDTDNDNNPVDGVYYIAVLPQTLASGLTLEIEKTGGMVATRTINSSITLNRSKIKEFPAPIDHGLEFKKGNIVLDCTDASKFRYGNPTTALVERTNSIYNPNSGGTVLAPFDFWLEGYEDYKFNGQVTQWTGSNPPCLSGVSSSNGTPRIKLPTIDGYKLASVKVTYSHSTSDRTISVTDGTNTFASCTMKRGDAASTLDLTHYSFTLSSDDRYLTYSSELGAKFILTYIPESEYPGPEITTDIVINCENAAAFRYNNGTGEVTLPARGSALGTSFYFWLQGSSYTFEGDVTYWSNGNCLCTATRTPIKVPTITGYALKEVRFTYQHSTKDVTYYVTDNSGYTSDENLTAHALGHVNGITRTAGGTIDVSSAVSSTDDRYLIAVGEFNVRMILTYKVK